MFPPGVEGFLRLYACALFCKARLGAESLSFVFPREVPWDAQLCIPLPSSTEWSCLTVPAHKPSIKSYICVLGVRGVQEASYNGRGGEVQREIGVPMGQLGGFLRQDSIPSGSWVGSLMEFTKCRICIFCWVPSPECWSLHPCSQLTGLLSLSAMMIPAVFLEGWDGGEPLTRLSAQLGRQGACSLRPHLPLWEEPGPSRLFLGTELCPLGEVTPWVKWDDSSYALQSVCCQVLCSSVVLELLHWTPGLPQKYFWLWVGVRT